MKRNVYLDHAAATPVAASVLRAMKPFFTARFGNASSLHSFGRDAEAAIDQSRKTIASSLRCLPDELIFTSGGTESINLALQGVIGASSKKKQHIISTAVEHAATYETIAELRKEGHSVTIVPVDAHGLVRPADILAAIRPDTRLISIIYVQNEIGTIEPVADLGRKLIAINRVRTSRGLPPVLLHADACQAPAFLEVNLQKLHADLASFDAAKMYGPKGVGLLFVRRGVTLQPLMHGGGQEQGLRSGTEPVPLIAGFAAAFRYVREKRHIEAARIAKLRDYLIRTVLERIPHALLTGHPLERIANNASFAFAGIEGESLVLHLDRSGIAASTGSACSVADPKPSPILAAITLPPRYRAGSLRLTMGYGIRKPDIDYAIRTLIRTVANLRGK